MKEEKAKKRRAKRLTEVVDFSECLDVHQWLAGRAKANHRDIGHEITYRLSAAKRSVESGAKNLKAGYHPGSMSDPRD